MQKNLPASFFYYKFIEVNITVQQAMIIHESRPSVFGGLKHYDNKGHKVGESRPGVFGVNHYDNKGHKTGHSNRGIFGDWKHYDDK